MRAVERQGMFRGCFGTVPAAAAVTERGEVSGRVLGATGQGLGGTVPYGERKVPHRVLYT